MWIRLLFINCSRFMSWGKEKTKYIIFIYFGKKCDYYDELLI